MTGEGELDRLVAEVRGSAKYRAVSAKVIRGLGAAELTKRRNLKEAIKATKNKLHQVAGAYLVGAPRYDAWLGELAAARAAGDEAFRAACERIMAHHSSTRERLPILSAFYAALADLPPIRSVFDVACGLNPLAIPWMPLAPGAEYYACDVYEDMAAFLDVYLHLAGVPGQAEVCNVLAGLPPRSVDLALVLKAIPCLEQADRFAGTRLLEEIDAQHLLVSFPVHSLGGKSKGMVHSYDRRFRELAAGKNWEVRRFDFPTELAFLVSRK